MFTKFMCCTIAGMIGTTLSARDGDFQIQIVTSKAIPVIESIAVYQTKNGKRASVAELSKFEKPLSLATDGSFEVFAKPKGGIPIKIAEKLAVKTGQTHELK